MLDRERKKFTPGGARIFGIIFAGFASIFMLVGGGMAWSQAAKLSGWLPVDATIVSSAVKSHRANKGTNYTPVVHFTYRVIGVEHSADTPLPLSLSTSSDGWAQEIVARFPAGLKTTAYYNPTAPDEAFLVREASVFPYLFILFPMLHVCIGLGVWWISGNPGLDSRGKAKRIGGIAAIWCMVGVLAFTHFVSLGGAFGLMATISFSVYAAIGAVLVLVWVRNAHRAVPATSAGTVEAENPFRTHD